MDQQRLAQAMLAERTAAGFLALVGEMTAAHPHPDGPTVRLTATVIDGGADLGFVDVDVTNLWDLGERARSRAANSAPTARPALRVVGGAA
ncbi:hypothetical protein [Streptomyces caniscabiei]|uniref:Uncharacterized protein n=1 Tax=Streptomyces caniscabiei TaxID=2746961 RepID=A0ABU4MZC4_9ACTN|nr:hypothetical protein [Streptomyces caniscabiei]MBE4790251.1 hypothetical protein [Streptomyces caniscabiei]MBE4799520.1 hypothetical protein [Streptomyces caniscabiei]MDX3015236.1 hypothetical protein [Streptomyces caniscabiei]MDX3042551.1 hypothetical protein [Streptomyces caniscabiei]